MYSITKAYEVAKAIGATVTIVKIKQCSDRGSYTSDMISKVRSQCFPTMILIRNTTGVLILI